MLSSSCGQEYQTLHTRALISARTLDAKQRRSRLVTVPECVLDPNLDYVSFLTRLSEHSK